jgi:CDGSH-type Zn-finger protein
MEKTIQLSANAIEGGSYELSGYYKLDLPTGEAKVSSGNTLNCLCETKQNKHFCDESHAKCVNKMVSPWF